MRGKRGRYSAEAAFEIISSIWRNYPEAVIRLKLVMCKYSESGHSTSTSALAKSDDFLCDNERYRMTQKIVTFGNPLDVIVRDFLVV